MLRSRTASLRCGRVWIDVVIALCLLPGALYVALRHLYHTNGVVDVADDEVSVVVDLWNGESSISTVPGYKLFVPWKQEVYALDKSPDEFVMEGAAVGGVNQVPQLEARAKDGSRFWFDRFTLQYALVADKAAIVLDDSGPGDGFKRDLVRSYARSILRDEIGRLSTEEAMRPDIARTATTRAMERLNAALMPHGIEVLEIATPKPSFDKQYEGLIDRRKQGDLEIERKRTYRAQLPHERDERLAAIREDKRREMDLLHRNLNVNRAAALRERERMRNDADIYFANRTRAGEAGHAELVARAGALRATYTGQVEDRRKEIDNLERYGEFAVRAALVQRLAGIEFSFAPYSRDSAPRRVEHEDVQAFAGSARK